MSLQPVLGEAAGRPQSRISLNPKFTFETFVVGPSNEFAHAMARRAASWDAGQSPLFLHAPFGFGKTHLLTALVSRAQEISDRPVRFLRGEQFVARFIRAQAEGTSENFIEDLLGAQMLVLDDVHFLGGKPSSQSALLRVVKAMLEEGKGIVLSSEHPPALLSEMEPSLRSYLCSGVVCGIDPADQALRRAILDRKLGDTRSETQSPHFGLREEVAEYLASHFTGSIRELEGALHTLVAGAETCLPTLSLDEAQAFLGRHLRSGTGRRITVDEIQRAVAEHYGLKQADLLSVRRTRAVARPRQAAMWICKQITPRSLPDIGRRFGGRDHTTVLHAVRRIEELKAFDLTLAADLEALCRRLQA